MTEKDFWTKYFRAEYLYSTKNTAVAAAEAAEDEELAVFLKPDEILAQEARQKVISFLQLKSFPCILIEMKTLVAHPFDLNVVSCRSDGLIQLLTWRLTREMTTLILW